jgi:CubicO group peptidase (beta-lactamase class C family)
MAEIFAGFDAIAGVIDFINTRNGHACELPAANGIATARALAKMYAACIGEVDGVRLLNSETVNRARKSRTKHLSQLPALAALPKAPGEGFGLGFGLTNPITKMLGPGSFGHDGAGGRLGFAHPEFGIAAGFVCNSMLWDNLSPDPRWSWIVPLREVVT